MLAIPTLQPPQLMQAIKTAPLQKMGSVAKIVPKLFLFKVQHYAPLIEKRLRWFWRRPTSTSWRLDETYIKVKGKWAYYPSP